MVSKQFPWFIGKLFYRGKNDNCSRNKCICFVKSGWVWTMLLWRERYHLLTLEIHFLTQSKWFNLRCFLRSFWCITLFKQLRQLFRRGVPKYLFCIWMWVQSKLSKFHPKHHFYCLLMCTFLSKWKLLFSWQNPKWHHTLLKILNALWQKLRVQYSPT